VDPNATYTEFRKALRECRIDDAADSGRDLLVWIGRGGFAPEDFDHRWFNGAMTVLNAMYRAARSTR
jgi:hypothetical protein